MSSQSVCYFNLRTNKKIRQHIQLANNITPYTITLNTNTFKFKYIIGTNTITTNKNQTLSYNNLKI